MTIKDYLSLQRGNKDASELLINLIIQAKEKNTHNHAVRSRHKQNNHLGQAEISFLGSTVLQ